MTPPVRPYPLDGNGVASLRPASPHSAAHAPVGAATPSLQRLADIFAEASEILGELASNQDIQLEQPRIEGLMNPVHSAPEQPSPGTTLDLLSIADMAGIMGVGDRTIRRWRSEGKLPPAIEIGGLLRWRREVVEAWIAAREGLEGSR